MRRRRSRLLLLGSTARLSPLPWPGSATKRSTRGGTATRAERLFRLVPEAVGGAVPDESHPALAGITVNSLKKIFQAVRMAQGWMRGEGVPMPKPAMGGRRGKAD